MRLPTSSNLAHTVSDTCAFLQAGLSHHVFSSTTDGNIRGVRSPAQMSGLARRAPPPRLLRREGLSTKREAVRSLSTDRPPATCCLKKHSLSSQSEQFIVEGKVENGQPVWRRPLPGVMSQSRAQRCLEGHHQHASTWTCARVTPLRWPITRALQRHALLRPATCAQHDARCCLHAQ